MNRKTILLITGCLICVLKLQAQTLKDAIKLSENDRFETAGRLFRNLIAQNPANGENYYYFGENYFKNEKPDSALYFYEKGIQSAPASPLNYIGKGKYQLYYNGLQAAQPHFAKALELGAGKNQTVLMEVADALIKAPNKDLDQAFKYLDQATKLDAKNDEVYILTGDYYLEKGDGNNAISNYKKAKELNKTSVKAILRMGQLYGRAKNYNLAFEFYQEAALIDSSFAPAYREQGDLYYMAKQYEKAKAKYKRYLDLAGDNFSARQKYAAFLFLTKDYTAALKLFNELEKIDTSKNFINRLMAYAYYETGDFATGTNYINKFFNRAANEKTTILASDFEYRGKLQVKSGKDSLGIIDLKKAMEMDSTKTDLYGEIASAYLKSKKYNDAIATYKSKEKYKKLNANDYFSLGRAYYFSKDYINADTSFAMVTIMQNNLPIGFLWRAKACVQLDPDNKKWLAKPYYESYLAKLTDPSKSQKDIVEAGSYLGYHYYVMKDNAKSKEYWQKVLDADPANEKAKKAMEGIK